jgi:hypothetical protein
MEDSLPPTPLFLPSDLNYPVTINRLHVTPGAQVRNTQPLFSFSHWVAKDGSREREVSVYESPVEGQVIKWSVREGDVIRTAE